MEEKGERNRAIISTTRWKKKKGTSEYKSPAITESLLPEKSQGDGREKIYAANTTRAE